MSENSEWIINTTDQTFAADVMARSQLGLVVVDFWAEWCAPCRMLGPLLEQLATEFAGRFTLVKADTELNQQAASEFGVSGIPAVFAVLEGQIVDGFQGALPAEEIRAWLDNLEAATTLVQAKQLADDDPAAAEAKIREILDDAPEHAAASLALAELLLAQDRDDECGEVIAKLEARGFLEPEAEQIKAALALKGRSAMDVDAAQLAAESNPDDFEAQYALAEALVGQGRHAEALDICLSLVERDRQDTGERARALMVEVFQASSTDPELINEYRRKLSMLLF